MTYIIFTDLDGTLLDHGSYSYRPALPALKKLKQTSTPLILASSKTAAEIAPLREELGFTNFPAIIENGAGLLKANDSCSDQIEPESDYAALRSILTEMPIEIRSQFQGFSDLSDEQVASLTGLSINQAQLAKNRQFSEPGLWSGSLEQQNQFEILLAAKGVYCRQGGRFLTLSFGKSKADRMRQIIDRLYGSGDKPIIVALGDAPNDIEMLRVADIGIVINNPAGVSLEGLVKENEKNIIFSSSCGPTGWNEMVLSLFHVGNSNSSD